MCVGEMSEGCVCSITVHSENYYEILSTSEAELEKLTTMCCGEAVVTQQGCANHLAAFVRHLVLIQSHPAIL